MSSHRSTTYTLETVEEIRRRLKALPEPAHDELSKMELVRELAADIAEQQKRGHSTQVIAELMAIAGVAFTPATLKSYLSKARPSARRPRRKRWRDSTEATTSTREDRAVAAIQEMPDPNPRASLVEEGDGEEDTRFQRQSDETDHATTPTIASAEKAATTLHVDTSAIVAGIPVPPPATSSAKGRGARPVNTVDALKERGDRKKETTGLMSRSRDAASEGGASVPRRATGGEIDKSRSTFTPREDSRDI
jgi:hypothetical protein